MKLTNILIWGGIGVGLWWLLKPKTAAQLQVSTLNQLEEAVAREYGIARNLVQANIVAGVATVKNISTGETIITDTPANIMRVTKPAVAA